MIKVCCHFKILNMMELGLHYKGIEYFCILVEYQKGKQHICCHELEKRDTCIWLKQFEAFPTVLTEIIFVNDSVNTLSLRN